MTSTTQEDPKATAIEELRDCATSAGHAQGFASAIEALRNCLRDGKPLQHQMPSVKPLDNPGAASFNEVWQHYAAVGFGSGWAEAINRLIELLTWLPKTLDGLDSHISEMRLSQAAKNNPLSLDTPVEDFDFTVRAYNCLKREGIHTLDELIKRSEADLLQIRNLGSKEIEMEIIPKLAEHGYQLAPSPVGA
jgi:DNA-directed RNA polymerase subunit alpha